MSAGRYNSELTPKTTFLFPGQGSQSVGMGKALAETFPSARRVFEEADGALGEPLSRLCFEGPEDQLRLTANTQPALLTVSIAAFEVLKERGIVPEYVAGHSLGEYSALVAAGSLQFSDAVRLVRKRGQYMQEAVPAGVGAMAAILKLPEGKLEDVLAEAAQGEIVSAANFNSPDQVVIAGHTAAVNRAIALAKAAGARRAVLLPVSAPFHCALMQPAQERLKADLDAARFADLACPLVNNWQAHEIRSGADAREGLYRQVPSPVRWVETIRLLAARGATRFLEVGAGTVLTGLLKNIDPALAGIAIGAPQDLDKLNAQTA
jgi:[acyl-carrier-protein] S-malonyltransferase